MRPILALTLTVALLALAPAPTSYAIISSDIRPDTGIPVIINVHVGADRFYNAGYFGARDFLTRAVIANVEAGHTWNLHETLSGVNTFIDPPGTPAPSPSTPRQFDYHATAVGFTMVGLGPFQPGIGYYYYQFGMAPDAALVSSAIATAFHPDSFDITTESLVHGYRSVMQTGVAVEVFPGISILRTADIVNSSWGFAPDPASPPAQQRLQMDPAGISRETMIIDALARAGRQTVTLAAGNDSGPLAMPAGGPASGYNSLAVGALAGDLTPRPYGQVADFSNQGPNDFFNPVTGQTLVGVRPGVDIAAPGTDLVLAAYTGTTGSNPLGVDPYPGATDLYWFGIGGTSFASPIVAGGAALLVDAANANFPADPHATDGRVIKAVLLNSAHKIAGWTNHTLSLNGVLTTTQGLDFASGAGALDLNAAYDQFLAGTANLPALAGGTVAPIGWDFGRVGEGLFNDYRFDQPLHGGDWFAATLDWFVNRGFDAATNTAFDVAFADLDLQFWRVLGGQPIDLVAESIGRYNNVEHLYFLIPTDGDYLLRVLWAGEAYDVPGDTPNFEDYGLAWSAGLLRAPDTLIPEPLTLLTSLGALTALTWQLSRRRRL